MEIYLVPVAASLHGSAAHPLDTEREKESDSFSVLVHLRKEERGRGRAGH